MKKILPYIIIVLLVVVISLEIRYIFINNNAQNLGTQNNNSNGGSSEIDDNVDKDLNEDNKTENEQLQDGIRFINIKEKDEKIIEEYEIILNGKTKLIEIVFTYEKVYDELEDSFNYLVNGEFNNLIVYTNVGFDDYNFSVNTIKSVFDESKFKIVKGIDNKNYLALVSYSDADFSDPTVDNTYLLYVLNDDLDMISNNLTNHYCAENNAFIISSNQNNAILEDSDLWYEDNFNACKSNECNVRVKIEDNKIYYLPVLDFNSEILEERIYTINNNKLEYKVINSYKIESIGNQC